MNPMLLEKRWFAIQVRPRYEKVASSILRGKGYEEFVPMYKEKRQWSDREKEVSLPLFTGYVFCRFDASVRAPIVTTLGVIRIVGTAKGPLPIQGEEIDAIQLAIKGGFKARPFPYTKIGDRVQITEGPLAGVEGVLVGCKNGSRLVLSVSLVQNSIAIEIDQSNIASIRRLPNSSPAISAKSFRLSA
jgi:transcription antitermination factor NusG